MLPVAHQQILRGVTATLSWQNVDGTGEAAAPAGAVTVAVTRADGTALVAAGTATSGTGSSPRTYTLTAANNTLLDMLTATWTDAGDGSTHVTYIEVVGAFYFTIAEARASDATLADTTKYPDAAITATRREVEEEFEEICRVAFVPRFRQQTLDGTGGRWFRPDRYGVTAVRSVRDYSDSDSYTSWTADELANLVYDDDGLVVSRLGTTFYSGVRNLVVAYEHGFTSPPAEVKRAALQRLRSRLNMSRGGIPDRATQFTVTDGGTFRLDTSGATKTGLPDVDAVLARWTRGALVA